MTVRAACVDAATGGTDAEGHLAGCASCRARAATLALVARAGAPDPPDLWPRLRARLAQPADGGRIDLRIAVPGWHAAAALAALVTAVLLAPEPGRLLAVMLGVV